MVLCDTDSSVGNMVDSTVSVEDSSKLCMVCEEAPKQYKCPRCDYFTCSLKCCKQHKIEVGNLPIGRWWCDYISNDRRVRNLPLLTCLLTVDRQTKCDGKRDRAAFISVKDFKEKNLRSDYHFLEDILQTKDSALRTLSLNCGERKDYSWWRFPWHFKTADPFCLIFL